MLALIKIAAIFGVFESAVIKWIIQQPEDTTQAQGFIAPGMEV